MSPQPERRSSRRDHRRRAQQFLGTALSVMLLGSVVAGAVALIVLPKLTESMPLTVLTGSMRPTYPEGTVVIVRPTPVDQLQVGDAITYQARSDHPEVVTHRITSVVFVGDGSRQFITQGDANGAPDPRPVQPGQIRGRIWYSVPYVGHLSNGLASGDGAYLIPGVAVGLLLYGGYLITSGAVERRDNRLVAQP